ncbi:hypothetical protein Hdeb2414_s0023g00623291 [Helianthus debilis subsp. tardiflorus]
MEGVVQLEFGDDEDDFRSCCGDEDELEKIVMNGDDELDEFSVRMLFKGVLVSDPGNGGFGVSGIGVIMEGPNEVPVISVQKKLEFLTGTELHNFNRNFERLRDQGVVIVEEELNVNQTSSSPNKTWAP